MGQFLSVKYELKIESVYFTESSWRVEYIIISPSPLLPSSLPRSSPLPSHPFIPLLLCGELGTEWSVGLSVGWLVDPGVKQGVGSLRLVPLGKGFLKIYKCLSKIQVYTWKASFRCWMMEGEDLNSLNLKSIFFRFITRQKCSSSCNGKCVFK